MTAIEGRAPEADLEIRLHGRGGQGGVTCAKILAAVYARLGRSVQSFGDYAGERSGAPVRAYTRVSDRAIDNRNKVYQPDHLLVLDPTLLGPDVVTGLADGGALVLNTPEPIAAFAGRFERCRLAVVDATAIARRHGIGTRSVVIVNTTIAGAFVRAVGLPLAALEEAYHHLGFAGNLAAAEEAYLATELREPVTALSRSSPARGEALAAPLPRVMPLVENLDGAPTGLATGNWRTQTPRYADHLAPCSAFCPAGNDVIGFLQALAQEGEAAAAAVLSRSTPLAGVCGRVCPAPCMEGCNRRELDGAVNIRALERWIADRAPIAAPIVAPASTAHRVAIVGGGPAGLAAAHALRLAGQRVSLFDAEPALGGVLRTGIPGYRLPREVLDREIEGLRRLGIEEHLGEALDAPRVAALAVEHDALIVATGLQKLRGLDGPGATLEGVEQGIHFLRRVNMEGGVALGGHVVVLGGGNTAMDCARSALRAGAGAVTVVYRRGRGEMPAIAEEVEQAEHEGVRLLFLRAPLGFEGEGRVRGVRLAEVALGPADESGRRRPVLSERQSVLACDTVLLALGQSADLSRLPTGWELREGRFYRSGVALQAFAAGDLSTGDGTVTHAIGDGRRAAGRAMRALGIDVALFERPDRTKAVAAAEIRFDHFARAEPARELLAPAATRARRWDEVSAGLSSAVEAQRCFSCGACTRCDTCLVYCPEGIIRRKGGEYEVDYSFCKGCGICVSECPRKAMEMST